jgi:hypothetical protein
MRDLDTGLAKKPFAYIRELGYNAGIPEVSKYSHINIHAAVALLCLRGRAVIGKLGNSIVVYHIDRYEPKSNLTFECKNILTLNKMVGR